MLPLLTLTAVAIGIVCGRLYSFIAVLLTGPLLALVGFYAAKANGWAFGPALLAGVGSLALSQLAFLAGVRLRADHHGRLRKRDGERSGAGQPRATASETIHRDVDRAGV